MIEIDSWDEFVDEGINSQTLEEIKKMDKPMEFFYDNLDDEILSNFENNEVVVNKIITGIIDEEMIKKKPLENWIKGMIDWMYNNFVENDLSSPYLSTIFKAREKLCDALEASNSDGEKELDKTIMKNQKLAKKEI